MEKVKPTCFKTREVLEQVEVLGYIKLKTFYLLKKIYTIFFFSFSFALLHCVAVIVTVTSQQEGSKSAAQY